MYRPGNKLRSGASALLTVIVLALIVGGVVITFLMWPTPAPRVLISNVSPGPKNGDRIEYATPIKLYWEALYGKTEEELKATIYIGESVEGLTEVAHDIKGTVSTASEGIYTFSYDARIDPHKQYWWKVKVLNNKGKFEEGGPWSFQLKNKEPEKPILTYPRDNEANVAIMKDSLRWNSAIDMDNDKITYDVYFGRELNLPPSTIIAKDWEKTDLSFDTLGKLDFSTRYYWRVVARDSQGAEVSSRTQGFTTEAIQDVPRPVKPQPEDGDLEFNPVKPVLSWGLTTERYYWPLEYEVYFSKADQSPQMIATTTETTLAIPELEGHNNYKWYVIIKDTERKRQKNGDLWSFETLNRNPVVRINQLEENDEAGIRKAELSWESYDLDGDNVAYDIYLSKSGGLFEEKAKDLVVTEFVIEDLESAKQYTARVIARDEFGAEGFADISFNSGNNNPVVNLVAPLDRAEVEPAKVLLNWDGYDIDGDDVTYTINLSDGNGYSNSIPVVNSGNYELPGLKSDTDYTWNVLAVDSKGATTTSGNWTFKTLNNPPELPVAVNPMPEETEIAIDQPVFEWSVSDSDNDSMTFTFMLSENREFTNSKTYETDLSQIKIPDTLESNHRYYWKVIASDSISSTESPAWSFVTFNIQPAEARLVMPVDGANDVNTVDTKFEWITNDPDDDFVESSIYLSEQDGIPGLIKIEKEKGETEYVNQTPLKPATIYTWWVVTKDGAGKEKKSSVYSFRTLNQPPVISGVNPSGFMLNGVTLPLTFDWNVEDPEGESVEVEVYLYSADSDAENVPVASGQNLNTYTFSGSVEPGSEYLLQIRATDRGGVTTASDPIRVRIASDAIEYITPANGSLFDDSTEFQWNYKGAGIPNDFIFRLYDSDGKLVVLDDLFSAEKSTYKYNGKLQEASVYYWTVTVNDGSEKVGPIYSFRVPLPKLEFYDAAPSDTNNIDSKDIRLSWNVKNVEGRDISYDVYVGNSLTPLYKDIKDMGVTLNKVLDTNAYYTWYVVANDGNGNKYRSPDWSFKTVNVRPVIDLLLPANNSKDLDGSITLSWEGKDSDSRSVEYEVFLGESENSMKSVVVTGNENFTLNDYDEGKTYYWMVRATDEDSSSDSSVNKFTTLSVAPDKLVAVLPGNNQIDVSENTDFIWKFDGADRPEKYSLYLGESSETLRFMGEFNTNNASLPASLNKGTRYYWKVVGIKDNGEKIESPVNTFIIAENAVDMVAYIWNGAVNVAKFDSPYEEPTVIRSSGSIDSSVLPIVFGEKVYAISKFGSLYTFVVSGNELKEVSRIQTSTAPETMKLVNNALWILDTKSVAAIVRISLDNSGLPGESEVVYKDWITPVDMAISTDGSTIVIADALSGLKILVRSSSTFREKALNDDEKFILEGYARTVELVGDFAYVGEAGIDGGLNVINLKDFTKNRVDGYYLAFQMARSGEILYVVTDKGLSVIDVSIPDKPEVIRNIDTAGTIRQLNTGKEILNIIGDRGTTYYNISIPEEPVLIK